ncbi:PEP-CTERM sorting domain-containing protein [Geomesophilobacter sediminis]|uniref:PEP-CTERM sorting domain-containing protein n=1 Tax=Geomesophilobacter sediminis TaxID=2798584 RepID=A0A8J7LY42_9BACT|nr:PEP-CTERM sorting domain-containing protein [Geomesophilobacter sediminis]MBJ6724291.1 PEP-CTERM sorting domain-containing protein [Geomesophilobacter sediminis]
MKKKMVALLAGALLSLSAGNALAYFGNGELVLYAYNNTSSSPEVGIDLGSISTLLAPGTDTVINTGTSLTGLKTGASYVYAGILGMANWNVNVGNVYALANSGLGSFSANTANLQSFYAANNNLNTKYGSPATATETFPVKGSGTYYGLMDKSSPGAGTYGSILPSSMAGQGDFKTSLAGDVVKGIYYLDNIGGSTTFVEVGKATFFANGNIEINTAVPTAPPTVPVPAALPLMATGLLGMAGLGKRKKSV